MSDEQLLFPSCIVISEFQYMQRYRVHAGGLPFCHISGTVLHSHLDHVNLKCMLPTQRVKLVSKQHCRLWKVAFHIDSVCCTSGANPHGRGRSNTSCVATLECL